MGRLRLRGERLEERGWRLGLREERREKGLQANGKVEAKMLVLLCCGSPQGQVKVKVEVKVEEEQVLRFAPGAG